MADYTRGGLFAASNSLALFHGAGGRPCLFPAKFVPLLVCRVKVGHLLLPDEPLAKHKFEDWPGPVWVFAVALAIKDFADLSVGEFRSRRLLHHLKNLEFHTLSIF